MSRTRSASEGGHHTVSWWRVAVRGMSSRLFILLCLILLLLASLTCFFRASVTILWVWDNSHTTWLVQRFEHADSDATAEPGAGRRASKLNKDVKESSEWERGGPPGPGGAATGVGWPPHPPPQYDKPSYDDQQVAPPSGNRSARGSNASDDVDVQAMRIYQYASVNPYVEKVDAPIIARLLATSIRADGSVQIPQPPPPPPPTRPGTRPRSTFPRTGGGRRWEAWELELLRPRYRPYWPQFLHLLRNWSASRQGQAAVPALTPPLPELVPGLLPHRRAQLGLDAHQSCAVVGNSGTLLAGDYGALIDSHDAVIRINGARTRGFERHVGAKTTLAFANSNVLRMYARPAAAAGTCAYPYAGAAPVPVVVYICQPAHLMEVAMCRALRPGTPLLVTDPRLDALCFRVAKWYSLTAWCKAHPKSCGGGTGGGGGELDLREWESKHGGTLFHHSSGMQAVVLALGLCRRVHLFGFGKVPGARHHYHSLQKAELSIHDYAAEYAFYADLAANRSALVPFLNESAPPPPGFTLPPLRIFS